MINNIIHNKVDEPFQGNKVDELFQGNKVDEPFQGIEFGNDKSMHNVVGKLLNIFISDVTNSAPHAAATTETSSRRRITRFFMKDGALQERISNMKNGASK